MIPQVASSFLGWGFTVDMKVVRTTPVDFEPSVEVLNVVSVQGSLQPMKPRDVQRKPEGERTWRWFTFWSTSKPEIDTVLQSPDGVTYRVQSVEDWSQAGFWKSELTQQPAGLP